MAPMNETTDKAHHEGYINGYQQAIIDMRQELLTLEADTNAPVSIEIYEILNFLTKQAKEELK